MLDPSLLMPEKDAEESAEKTAEKDAEGNTEKGAGKNPEKESEENAGESAEKSSEENAEEGAGKTLKAEKSEEENDEENNKENHEESSEKDYGEDYEEDEVIESSSEEKSESTLNGLFEENFEEDSSGETGESAESDTAENSSGFEGGSPEGSSEEAFEEDVFEEVSGGGFDEDGSDDLFEEEYFEASLPDDDFESLLESTQKEVLGITKDAETLENENKEIDITEGVASKEIHKYNGFKIVKPNKDTAGYALIKEKNQALIKGLVNEIRVALESRKAYELRGLNKGRLHSGSLWKLAIPDPTVFSKRHIPGDVPELAAYILIDLSGSMREREDDGRRRVEHAKDAACVISEACRELKIPHAITGFKEDYYTCIVEHYPAVTFEDGDSSRIAGLHADGNNRDGYSIRVATNELATRPEPRKILFVLSDGLPIASGRYCGLGARYDVREAVLEARKRGIRVISLKFGDISGEDEFRFMYDTPVFAHDILLLPKALGSVFKRVLLE